jgi:ribosomal protein S12 methylthiotransferase accessory factor
MLALALGMKEEALENVEWIINFNQLSEERLRLYKTVAAVLNTDLNESLSRNDLRDIWKLMFSEDILTKAENLVDARDVFDGMPSDDLTLKSFATHRLLIAAYEKLQIAKRR